EPALPVSLLSFEVVNQWFPPLRSNNHDQQAILLQQVIKHDRPAPFHESGHRKCAHAEHRGQLWPALVKECRPSFGLSSAGNAGTKVAHGWHHHSINDDLWLPGCGAFLTG